MLTSMRARCRCFEQTECFDGGEAAGGGQDSHSQPAAHTTAPAAQMNGMYSDAATESTAARSAAPSQPVAKIRERDRCGWQPSLLCSATMCNPSVARCMI